MFKSQNENSVTKSNDSSSPEKLNRIVSGTSLEGVVITDSNIRIDGKLKGSINAKGRLVIGPTGSVYGDIVCENADIEGIHEGKITVHGLLLLKSSAKLKGDIFTNKMAIEAGANFTGTCSMGSFTKDAPVGNPSENKLNPTREQREAKAIV
jgi:cytoskeletal protein CcmA (bactofilin family)